jgi:hypothetical protein
MMKPASASQVTNRICKLISQREAITKEKVKRWSTISDCMEEIIKSIKWRFLQLGNRLWKFEDQSIPARAVLVVPDVTIAVEDLVRVRVGGHLKQTNKH